MAQRLRGPDREDDRRPRHAQAPEAARGDRAVRLAAARSGRDQTNALESLVIAGFVRGLSVRDVEAALAEALGPDATVSKSTVSRVCQAIKDEFDAFKHRSLADIELEYLSDGSHFKYHAGAKAEPVLVAWGITTTGKPVLLRLAPGSSGPPTGRRRQREGRRQPRRTARTGRVLLDQEVGGLHRGSPTSLPRSRVAHTARQRPGA